MADTIIHKVRFDERGLIAAVIQDAGTSEVIALRYIDNDTLARSLQSGKTELLAEAGGKTVLPLLDVRVNSDGSSLTILVQRGAGESDSKPVGLLRETPETSKAVSPEVSLVDVGSMEFGVTVGELYALISERNETRPEGSYTTYLFNSGLDKILKKIAEESGEVIIAAKNNSERELISELADVVYHLLVLMVERNVKVGEVAAELTRRAAKRFATPEPR